MIWFFLMKPSFDHDRVLTEKAVDTGLLRMRKMLRRMERGYQSWRSRVEIVSRKKKSTHEADARRTSQEDEWSKLFRGKKDEREKERERMGSLEEDLIWWKEERRAWFYQHVNKTNAHRTVCQLTPKRTNWPSLTTIRPWDLIKRQLKTFE